MRDGHVIDPRLTHLCFNDLALLCNILAECLVRNSVAHGVSQGLALLGEEPVDEKLCGVWVRPPLENYDVVSRPAPLERGPFLHQAFEDQRETRYGQTLLAEPVDPLATPSEISL